MTVPYMKNVTEANIKTFIRMLFCWRGSVWKSVYYELFVYAILYYSLTIFYSVFLASNPAELMFEQAVRFFSDLVPITFTTVSFSMGFYVTQIYSRWWSVFMMLPWPDTLTFEICAYFRDRPSHKSDDEHTRMTMARHLCLSFVLVFRDISERIKRRFPTLKHLVGSLLTPNELRYLKAESIRERRYWIPIEWIATLLKKAYKNKQIDDLHYSKMITSLLDYRERLHNVYQYDTVNLPLVYTQVVHLVTYAYFGIQLIASQKIYSPDNMWFENLPLPGYALIEFIFLVGWLKTAETMLNPFGMDDDDFDVDILIERNFLVSSSAFGNLFEKAPEMVDIDFEVLLPTEDVEDFIESRPKNVLQGSVVNVEIPKAQQAQVTILQNPDAKSLQFVVKEPIKTLLLEESPPPPIPAPSIQPSLLSMVTAVPRRSAVEPRQKTDRRSKVQEKTDRRKTAAQMVKSGDRSRNKLPTPSPSRMDEMISSKRKALDANRVAEKLEEIRKSTLEKKEERKTEREVMQRTQVEPRKTEVKSKKPTSPLTKTNDTQNSATTTPTTTRTISLRSTQLSRQLKQ